MLFVEADSNTIVHSKTVYIIQIFQVELKLQFFKEGTHQNYLMRKFTFKVGNFSKYVWHQH